MPPGRRWLAVVSVGSDAALEFCRLPVVDLVRARRAHGSAWSCPRTARRAR